MRIIILAVGRCRDGAVNELFARYAARIGWTIAVHEILPRAADAKAEGAAFLNKVPRGTRLVALDEHGVQLTSDGLATILQDSRDDGEDVAFAIGGPDGLPAAVLRRADATIAFGRVTWPHMLMRALLAEQLYRCHAILHGHPYHRDGPDERVRTPRGTA